MSGDGTTASAAGTSNERQAEPKLYSASGEPLRTGSRSTSDQKTDDQLIVFVREQPFTAALVALVVGYFLGKIT
jgi:ElaB/YqjD/DUF883 family membrane-anchored ribosome-binding protein